MNDITAAWHIISQTDWLQEKRLLTALLSLYSLLVILTVATWRRLNFQAAYFGLLCIAIYAAENLNEWCAKNWKVISSHQYFDSSGLFISVVYSVPILFNLLLLVIVWMRSASIDLIEVKRKEAIRKSKQTSKKEK